MDATAHSQKQTWIARRLENDAPELLHAWRTIWQRKWGILGLVFAALVAAIIASTGSKINSIATIFTMDLYRSMRPDTEQRT